MKPKFSRAPQLPLPSTYWVVPGRLLAGEYPGTETEPATRQRLEQLHAVGIDFFLDLTEAGELAGYRHLLPRDTKYLRAPIADHEVPESVVQMQVIQARIRAALLFGRSIYVHCRAGIGRTGVVVGCYVVEQGLDGKSALKRINRYWRQCARSKSWPRIPQTAQQEAYILRWSDHRKFYNRADPVQPPARPRR